MRFVYHFFEKEINSSEYLEKIECLGTGKIHKSWYNGTTGIFLFDNLIQKILKTGYAHHIERLMIINNAMIMYGFSRKEIYKWFMSMFVDSYDWVMNGCVSMNHNSLNDRVRYMSRVYLAGDNYIKKMSDYRDKDSMEVMKNLFKSFAKKHSSTLKSDYNMASYIARHVKN
jgi:deoxyribodipyrimidine photolyase-related protein